jgi:hypothetical protein
MTLCAGNAGGRLWPRPRGFDLKREVTVKLVLLIAGHDAYRHDK